MDRAKQKRLEAAGWRVGTVQDFLGLSDEETVYIELKVRLANAFVDRRRKCKLTQSRAAKILKSSQSRIAKLESADPSVSADLLIRGLLRLGATPRDVARAISA